MNIFTELKVLSFQKVAFAQNLTTTHYHYDLDNHGYGIYGQAPKDGGVLEIGFVEQNPVVLRNETEEILVEENCIFIIPPASRFSVQSKKEGMHRHTSVEFLIRGQWKRVASWAPENKRFVTLPMVIPPSAGSGEIFSLIRAMVCAQTTEANRSYFEECADFMLLIHKLSLLSRSFDTTKNTSPGNRRYCERSKAYISENISKRMSVGEIADAVGVSKNYLTNVFSRNEGISLVEYINRRKLSYMMELIRRYNYPLSEAGEQVGFTDSNYVSRIFKRYYGITLTEYKRSKKLSPEEEIDTIL